MEFLNRFEIQGVTGAVAITPVGDTRMARFSVVIMVPNPLSGLGATIISNKFGL